MRKSEIFEGKKEREKVRLTSENYQEWEEEEEVQGEVKGKGGKL